MLRSIYARTFLLIVVAVVVAQGISMLVPGERAVAAVRLDDIARLLRPRDAERPPDFDDGGPHGPSEGGPPPDLRPRFVPDSGGPPGALRDIFGFSTHTSTAEPQARQWRAAPELQAELAALVGVSVSEVRFFAQEASLPLRQGFLAAVRQTDGRWRVAEREAQSFPTAQQQRELKILALELMALLPLAWLFARTLSAPIRRFGEAARLVGQDAGSAPLPREGPAEVQAAIDAFNAMQSRLSRLIQERTRMVGAIAHDLRTPLTRLAFRLDDLPPPLSDKVHADIDEMKSMITAALEFIRDRSLHLPRERLDLRLLVERVVNDLADLGHDVSLQSGGPITVEGVPLALRRLVSNLLENAVKFGQRARVRLNPVAPAARGRERPGLIEAGTAMQVRALLREKQLLPGEVQLVDERCTLEVDDDGPGIPEALQEQVFEPFFRVEGSRNRDTGGIGLGLSAVRAIALEHGGEVRLGNRKEGGLRVSVSLPVARA